MTNEELCVLAQNGDENAKQQLVLNNMRFVQRIANDQAERYKDFGIESEELAQEGYIGILESVDKFAPEKGCRFLTYAVYRILKNMQKLIENYGYKEYDTDEKTGEKNYLSFISFDGANDNYDGENNTEYIERILCERQSELFSSTPENIFFENEKHKMICNATDTLNSRQKEYISYRFGLEHYEKHTRKDTADYFHLRDIRAKHLEKDALKNMRDYCIPFYTYIDNSKPDEPEDKEYLMVF